METQNPSKSSIFQSTTLKMILIGILSLVLLIPLSFVENLILERSQRQKDVVFETTSKWGEAIKFYGLVLKIPYFDAKVKTNYYAYFFPDEMNAISTVTMEEPLQRSIYKSNVFGTKMKFSGYFYNPNSNFETIPSQDIRWDQAKIILKTSNLKSLKEEVKMTLGSQNFVFEPNNENSESLVSPIFDAQILRQKTKFNFEISFNGSQKIEFIPIGKTTSIKMQSNWNSPNFNGTFAPVSRKISDSGFDAEWKILHFNRPFAQYYLQELPNLDKYNFGVEFITPVDEYLQNERAVKYGFLVIGLTFLIFFIIQSISKISIHIFQYGMIGVALVMFYTLLISITEHSSFAIAYGIASVSVLILIATYSISILKNKKFPLFIAIALAVLYSFIFVIIQLEDFALLVGSIGLFLILAAVMYFSRKIEWNK